MSVMTGAETQLGKGINITDVIALVTTDELNDSSERIDKLLTEDAWNVMNMVAFD
ncbi:hypothetical protein [Streptomyces sp. A1136]|uniref:hypothetical protein n=1 Tax=Streptomyces sp. A1136 TaxID=2563102 RepID=UPI001445B9C1|nr:hypothetical protein [Streptomyces sp. A1136]